MPAKRFLVHYPDDSKERINADQRDEMILRDELQELGGGRYLFVGVYTPKSFKCKSFEGLRSLLILRGMTRAQMLKFVEMAEILFDLYGEWEWQSEETPAGLYERLVAMGMPEEGFSDALRVA